MYRAEKDKPRVPLNVIYYAHTMKGMMTTLFAFSLFLAAAAAPVSEVEVWNAGVASYEAGDVTNALHVLRPLMRSKAYGARAAEVVAALEQARGNREAAAEAAQLALRAHPTEARVNRNFTRAIDGLLEERQARRREAILKAAEGKDPSALLSAATEEARRLFSDAGTYRTNAAPRAVALAQAYEARAEKLAEAWVPVRAAIVQAVTNEQQAATILADLDQAEATTSRAARELGDLSDEAYARMSQVEHDLTRFLKMLILPPQAIEADLVAQSNAWLDVEAFNTRAWQPEALAYTRAFRAKFPMWARAYEQQAQADTNQPPFTAEAQAKVSALATELEKLQLACCERVMPPEQEQAINLILEIRELLPKGGSSGGTPEASGTPEANGTPESGGTPEEAGEPKDEESKNEDAKEDSNESDSNEASEAREVDALLRKAQERTDEHEAEKKARLRKAPLPPNERDW